MIIAVNVRLLQKNRNGGIERFEKSLLKLLVKAMPEHQFYFIFDRNFDSEYKFADNVICLKCFPPTRHPILQYLWLEISVPRVLKRIKADIFFSPDGFTSLRARNIKKITVIHDLNFFYFDNVLKLCDKIFWKHFIPLYARISDITVTVSEFSKHDLIHICKLESSKVRVVYNFYDFQPRVFDLHNKKKYFLFVGNLSPRKNLSVLLRAFDKFCISHSDYRLIVAGGVLHKAEDVFSTYQNMRFGDNVDFLGSVSDIKLQKLYQEATALVFPSLFEGFGLPVIEAWSQACNVICSDTGSLKEIAGDAALLIDPLNQDAWTEAMIQISQDRLLQTTLYNKSVQRIKLYDSEKAVNAYKQILTEK